MKNLKKYKQQRREQWYNENCLNEDNLYFINKSLLKPFKIKTIPNGYGEEDILLEYNLHQYKIQVDKDNSCLILLEKNNCYNKKDKEYYHLLEKYGDKGCFYGIDVWFDIMEAIINRG